MPPRPMAPPLPLAPGTPVDATLWNLAERLIATAPPETSRQDSNPPRATFPRPGGEVAAPASLATMPTAGRMRLVRLPNGQTIAVPFNPDTGLPMLSGVLPQSNQSPVPNVAPAHPAEFAQFPAMPPSPPQPTMIPSPQNPSAVRPFTLTSPPPAVEPAPGSFALSSIAFGADRSPPALAPTAADRGAGRASFSILRQKSADDPNHQAAANQAAPAAPRPTARPAALAETLPSAAPSTAPSDDDDWDDEPSPGISILGWLGVVVVVAGAAVVASVFQGWI